MLDVQPPYFGDRIASADIVIDHHPGYAPNNAAFQDLRPGYGATSTIMTEYMITADEHISERLGYRAAVWHPQRHRDALAARDRRRHQAFTQLYPNANYSLLRQIERPELPLRFARMLSRAMRRFEIHDGVVGAASRQRRARRPDRADGGFLPAVRGRGMGGGVGQARTITW